MLRSTSAGETGIPPSALSWAGLAACRRVLQLVVVSRHHRFAQICRGDFRACKSACHCLIVSPGSGWPRRVALGTVAKSHAAAARWSFFPGQDGLRAREGSTESPACNSVMPPNESMLHRWWTSQFQKQRTTTTKARRHGIILQSRGSILLA